MLSFFYELIGKGRDFPYFCKVKKPEKNVLKFTLLVVGRTVEKHYITAINDYVERTKHFISFDMEVIPELKNTKNLSMEQQKEKERKINS